MQQSSRRTNGRPVSVESEPIQGGYLKMLEQNTLAVVQIEGPLRLRSSDSAVSQVRGNLTGELLLVFCGEDQFARLKMHQFLLHLCPGLGSRKLTQ